MQTKPKAYVFMEGLLAEAEFPKGHWPQWIEALYPELHRVLTEELSPQVPDEHMTEFSKIQMLGTDGEALQKFIDKHIQTAKRPSLSHFANSANLFCVQQC